MVLYMLIGIAFGILMELIKDRVIRKYPSLYPFDPNVDPFNMWMRLLMICIWPFCLIVFCIGFYRNYK